MTTVAVVNPSYEIYGVPRHITVECQLLVEPTLDQVNYAQGYPYSKTYNLGWRNHPNLSYKNNNHTFALSSTSVIPLGFQGQKEELIAPAILKVKP